MATETKTRKPVVQDSNGKATKTHFSGSLFLEPGTYLSCQVSDLSDTIALSVSIGYNGRMAFHGTVADIARMVELMRTTLAEYTSEEVE